MAGKRSTAMVLHRKGAYAPVLNLRRELDNFMNSDIFDIPDLGGKMTMPSVDMWDDKKNIYVETEMPGINPKDIEVKITGNNNLEMSALSESEKEQKHKNFFRSERYRGSFYREVSLPEPVHGEKAQAKYRNGVLEIVIPKDGHHKGRAVNVKVKG